VFPIRVARCLQAQELSAQLVTPLLSWQRPCLCRKTCPRIPNASAPLAVCLLAQLQLRKAQVGPSTSSLPLAPTETGVLQRVQHVLRTLSRSVASDGPSLSEFVARGHMNVLVGTVGAHPAPPGGTPPTQHGVGLHGVGGAPLWPNPVCPPTPSPSVLGLCALPKGTCRHACLYIRDGGARPQSIELELLSPSPPSRGRPLTDHPTDHPTGLEFRVPTGHERHSSEVLTRWRRRCPCNTAPPLMFARQGALWGASGYQANPGGSIFVATSESDELGAIRSGVGRRVVGVGWWASGQGAVGCLHLLGTSRVGHLGVRNALSRALALSNSRLSQGGLTRDLLSTSHSHLTPHLGPPLG
jgi:hypothetical protein